MLSDYLSKSSALGLVLTASLLVNGCRTNVGTSDFQNAPKIISETNKFDRTFVLKGSQLWERRWSPGDNWSWIHHSALSGQIAGFNKEDLALGPLLCNDAESVCRIWMQVEGRDRDNLFENSDDPNRWLMYTFNPNETDFSNFSTFDIGSFQAIENRWIDCQTNLAYDGNWNMYCARDFVQDADLTAGDVVFEIVKYDLNLNHIDRTSPIKAARTDLGSIDVNVRPCVMSEHDVFFPYSLVLYHANAQMDTSFHHGSFKYTLDTSQSYDNQCQTRRQTSKKIYGRRFSQSTGTWQWDDNGRPESKRDIKEYGLGSMRSGPSDRLYLLMKPKFSNTRVYERYPESGTWHWADHGYPEDEVISELGWIKNGTYFVTTQSGNLYQNQWRSDLGRWAWENHGEP